MTALAKANRIQSFRTMITGVKTNVDPKATIPIAGTPTPQPTAVAALQAYIDASDAVTLAEAAFHEAVAKQDAAFAAANGTYLGVKAYALATYVKQPTVLGTFGLQVPVRKVPDAATKAAAVAKAKATRLLRGTTSKKQKALIKAPAAPAPAAPAPAATSSATTTPKS